MRSNLTFRASVDANRAHFKGLSHFIPTRSPRAIPTRGPELVTVLHLTTANLYSGAAMLT
jgi:hypothetical protein